MAMPADPLVHRMLRKELLSDTAETLTPEHVLTRHVGFLLFEQRWLAPRETVAEYAVDSIRLQLGWESEGADHLMALFRETVHSEAKRFAYDFESNGTGAVARQFGLDLAAAFGVNDTMAPLVLVSFHEAETADRLGLLLLLEDSRGFTGLTVIIDTAPGGNPITPPLTALSNLMRTLPRKRRRRRPPVQDE